METIEMTLRGLPVEMKGNTIYITLRYSEDGQFSINDKIKEYIDRGYKVEVSVDGQVTYLDVRTNYVSKERVVTKFKDSQDWFKYWYEVGDKPAQEVIDFENIQDNVHAIQRKHG
tara:strand:+ start:497 stop:841 length:345 start_codon:yes stop_codon:yes gene_type:complete